MGQNIPGLLGKIEREDRTLYVFVVVVGLIVVVFVVDKHVNSLTPVSSIGNSAR